MAKYTPEEKFQAVLRNLEGKESSYCYDNYVMENYFGIMKSEFLYLKELESVKHFKLELENYNKHYNTKRIKAK